MGSTDGLDEDAGFDEDPDPDPDTQTGSSQGPSSPKSGGNGTLRCLSLDQQLVVSSPPPQIFEEDTFISRDRSGPTADGSPRAQTSKAGAPLDDCALVYTS